MLNTSLDYREEAPASSAVDASWTLQMRHDCLESPPYLALPDGCLDLIYRLKRDGAGKVVSAALLVAGPTLRPATFFPSAGEEFAGVRFAPGWGGISLGLCPAELCDQFLAARELSRRLAQLEDRLFASTSVRAAVETLRAAAETWAAERWAAERAGSQRVLRAVQMLRFTGGDVGLELMAHDLGISPRSFRREIIGKAGLPPKALLRIFRFRRALCTIRQGAAMSLSSVAAETGFADQAHMTQEFQALGGFTPGRPTAQGER